MKLIINFTFLFLILLSFVSCSSKSDKKRTSEYVDPRADQYMQRTSRDTLQVLDLAEQYLTKLKNKDIDGALGLLSEVEGKKVTPLSSKHAAELRNSYNLFPVLSYHIDEVVMYSDSDTEVRYTAVFFEKSKDDKRPNTIQGIVCPRRVDGKWLLTLDHEKREDNFKQETN